MISDTDVVDADTPDADSVDAHAKMLLSFYSYAECHFSECR